MCSFSRLILFRMTTTMRGMELTGPPECRLAEWSTDRSCSLERNLLQVIMMSKWIVSINLFDCCLTWWSTIEAELAEWRLTPSGYNHRSKVQPTGLLQEWFRTMECRLSRRFSLLNMILWRVAKRRISIGLKSWNLLYQKLSSEGTKKRVVDEEQSRRRQWDQENAKLWYQMLYAIDWCGTISQHSWLWRSSDG